MSLHGFRYFIVALASSLIGFSIYKGWWSAAAFTFALYVLTGLEDILRK